MGRRLLLLLAAGAVGLLVLPLAVLTIDTAQAGTTAPSSEAVADIPPRLLAAYQHAADRCPGLPWPVLAGIGKIESDHARIGGATTTADGLVTPAILGPALDGAPGVATIVDTDRGRYDGDTVHDRAVGPMQFIPSTWTSTGVDGDGDGAANPHDVDDATATAAAYLCDAGAGDPARLRQAIWTYNHSFDYVDNVRTWAARYTTPTPAGPADPNLITAVLDNPRIDIYDAGRADIAAGHIDNRILAMLQTASQRWTLAVSSLQTGHSKCVGGGNYPGCSVSNHWHGRAVDIYRVNSQHVTPKNPHARDLALWLDTLPTDLRPDETGSPFPALSHLPGHFSDSSHLDHVHAAHDR